MKKGFIFFFYKHKKRSIGIDYTIIYYIVHFTIIIILLFYNFIFSRLKKIIFCILFYINKEEVTALYWSYFIPENGSNLSYLFL